MLEVRYGRYYSGSLPGLCTGSSGGQLFGCGAVTLSVAARRQPGYFCIWSVSSRPHFFCAACAASRSRRRGRCSLSTPARRLTRWKRDSASSKRCTALRQALCGWGRATLRRATICFHGSPVFRAAFRGCLCRCATAPRASFWSICGRAPSTLRSSACPVKTPTSRCSPALPIHDVFVCGAGQALSQGPVPLSRLREMRLIMLERQSSSRRPH